MSVPSTAFEAQDEVVFFLSAARGATTLREADHLYRQAANYGRLASYLRKEPPCPITTQRGSQPAK